MDNRKRWPVVTGQGDYERDGTATAVLWLVTWAVAGLLLAAVL